MAVIGDPPEGWRESPTAREMDGISRVFRQEGKEVTPKLYVLREEPSHSAPRGHIVFDSGAVINANYYDIVLSRSGGDPSKLTFFQKEPGEADTIGVLNDGEEFAVIMPMRMGWNVEEGIGKKQAMLAEEYGKSSPAQITVSGGAPAPAAKPKRRRRATKPRRRAGGASGEASVAPTFTDLTDLMFFDLRFDPKAKAVEGLGRVLESPAALATRAQDYAEARLDRSLTPDESSALDRIARAHWDEAEARQAREAPDRPRAPRYIGEDRVLDLPDVPTGEQPATAADRPFVEFMQTQKNWEWGSDAVPIHLDGADIEADIWRDHDDPKGLWYTHPEAPLGPAAGRSWPTLEEAQTAIREALGDVAPKQVEPVDFSSPYMHRSGNEAVRIFLEGQPLNETIEEDPDAGEWVLDAPADVEGAEPSELGLQPGDNRRFPNLDAAQDWVRTTLQAAIDVATVEPTLPGMPSPDLDSGVAEPSISDPTTRRGHIGIPANPGDTAEVDGEIISPLEVPELVQIAHELGSPVRVRNMPKAEGMFTGPGGILLKPSLFTAERWRELSGTLAHEIGHLVDWLPQMNMKRGNLLGRVASLLDFTKHSFSDEHGEIRLKPLRDELVKVSNEWRPWDPEKSPESYRKYRAKSKELYADAISALLVNPKYLRENAPQFYQAFFDRLDAKPEVRDSYFKVQALMSGDRAALLEERDRIIRDGFQKGREKAAETQRERELLAARAAANPEGIAVALLDKKWGLKRRAKQAGASEEENPTYDLGFLNQHNLRPFWEEKVRPIMGKLVDSGLSVDDFDTFLLYRRIAAGDRGEMLNPGGLSGISHESVATEIAKERRLLAPKAEPLEPDLVTQMARYQRIIAGTPDMEYSPDEARVELDALMGGLDPAVASTLQEAAENVYKRISEDKIESAQEMLDRQTKAMTDEQRTAIEGAAADLDSLVRYVQAVGHSSELFTDKLYEQMADSQYWVHFNVVDHMAKQMSHVVRHQVGTAKDVASPFLATVRKMLVTLRAAEVNRAQNKAIRFLQRRFPGDIENAPTETVMKSGGGVQRRARQPAKDKGMVRVWQDGKLAGYHMETGLADGINNTQATPLEAVVGTLEFLNSKYFRRVHITGSPAFLAFNPFRDIKRMWRNNPHMRPWRFWEIPRDFAEAAKSIPGALVRGTDYEWTKKLAPKSWELIRKAEKASIFGPRRRSDYLLGRSDDAKQIDEMMQEALEAFGDARPKTTLRKILWNASGIGADVPHARNGQRHSGGVGEDDAASQRAARCQHVRAERTVATGAVAHHQRRHAGLHRRRDVGADDELRVPLLQREPAGDADGRRAGRRPQDAGRVVVQSRHRVARSEAGYVWRLSRLLRHRLARGRGGGRCRRRDAAHVALRPGQLLPDAARRR